MGLSGFADIFSLNESRYLCRKIINISKNSAKEDEGP
jgi:hypothetical protein